MKYELEDLKVMARLAPVRLDGHSLTVENLADVARAGSAVTVGEGAMKAVVKSRRLLEKLIANGETVYGVNTGFGELCNSRISGEDAVQLQENLVRSTCAGTGAPLSVGETRAMMLLRLNTLVRGYSGVRREVIELLANMLNSRVHPVIPSRGSVGASGDLAPLAHMASVMMGEGYAFAAGGEVVPGAEALRTAGLSAISLKEKEGLALINGTQFMTGLGALAVHDAGRLLEQAITVFAMSLEALGGNRSQFDMRVMKLRPHAGMAYVAERINRAYADSRRAGNSNVQDPYTLRCAPQVLGPLKDMIDYCRNIITVEMNSTTDNPIVLPEDGEIISAGNFHGQPVAVALDSLCIPVQALMSFSERRTARLIDSKLSGLNAFLADRPGLESGYMVPQYTAAALVSEGKVLCHPASSDSIPTSANQEDFVSMGAYSAIKLRQLIDSAYTVVGIEAMCAARALDLTGGASSDAVKRAHADVRKRVKGFRGDRAMSDDISACADMLRAGSILG